MTPVDEDALNVMKQAGQEFADKQVGRWLSDDWGDLGSEMRQRRWNHWRAVRDRIPELVGELKQQLKTQKGEQLK